MAKESIYSPDKRCIFREVFDSEQGVRSRNGVPTAITFNNGVGSFNGTSSNINYNLGLNGIYSVRIRCSITNFTSENYLFDCRSTNSNGTGYIYVAQTTGVVNKSSGTIYINGGVGTTLVAGSNREIIITGISLIQGSGSNLSLIGARLTNSEELLGSIELLEIYEGTLTANEVANMYNNKTYKQPVFNGGLTGSNLIVDGTFNDITKWSTTTGWSITDRKAVATLTSTGLTPNPGTIMIIGKKYKLIVDYIRTNGTLYYYNGSGVVSMGTIGGTYTTEFTALGTTFSFSGSSFSGSIDNVTLIEIAPSTILSVDAYDGVIKNRLSGSVASELIINGDFSSDTTWTKGAGWTISGGKATKTAGVASNLSQPATSVSKRYRVIFTISNYSAGTINAQLSGGGGGTGTSRSANGTYIEEIISGSSAGGNFYLIASSTFAGDIDNVSIQEVVPDIVNTATTVVRDGNVNVMRFDNVSSRLDCGSYNGLIGDITVLAWVKIKGWGEDSQYGRILKNDKLIFSLYRGISGWYITSEGTTTCSSSSNVIKLTNSYVLLAFTRTSTGVTNLYQNAVLTGSANQAGGAPAIGTTNIYIGNEAGSSRTFDGNIASIKIYSGILSLNEITQLYISEKHKFNL